MRNKVVLQKRGSKFIKRTLAVILVGAFLFTEITGWAAGNNNLAPALRANSGGFKELYRAAAICDFIEKNRSLDGIKEILDKLQYVKTGFDNIHFSVISPYEAIIEIPDDGMAVRYFDPTKANVITPYSDVSKLETKVIGPRLNRQIIRRAKALPAKSAARMSASGEGNNDNGSKGNAVANASMPSDSTLLTDTNVIIIAGPSGAGKSTFIEYILRKYPERFVFPKLITTRGPRQGEVSDKYRTCVDRDAFDKMRRDDRLCMVRERHGGHLYGMDVAELDRYRREGKVLLLDTTSEETIDELIRPIFPQAKVILVLPTSFEEFNILGPERFKAIIGERIDDRTNMNILERQARQEESVASLRAFSEIKDAAVIINRNISKDDPDYNKILESRYKEFETLVLSLVGLDRFNGMAQIYRKILNLNHPGLQGIPHIYINGLTAKDRLVFKEDLLSFLDSYGLGLQANGYTHWSHQRPIIFEIEEPPFGKVSPIDLRILLINKDSLVEDVSDADVIINLSAVPSFLNPLAVVIASTQIPQNRGHRIFIGRHLTSNDLQAVIKKGLPASDLYNLSDLMRKGVWAYSDPVDAARYSVDTEGLPKVETPYLFELARNPKDWGQYYDNGLGDFRDTQVRPEEICRVWECTQTGWKIIHENTVTKAGTLVTPLHSSRQLSEERIAGVRDFLQHDNDTNVVGLVVYGSAAAGESTSRSDLDYILIKDEGKPVVFQDQHDLAFHERLTKRFSYIEHMPPTALMLHCLMDTKPMEAFDEVLIRHFLPHIQKGEAAISHDEPGSLAIRHWTVVARTPEIEKHLAQLIREHIDNVNLAEKSVRPTSTIAEPQDFVNKLQETWQYAIDLSRFDGDGQPISGPFKFDPNSLKSKGVGRFQVFFNPWRTMGGLKPINPTPTKDFSSMPQEAKLFMLQLFGFSSLITINQRPVNPNNFLLIPNIDANLDQRLTDKALAVPIILTRAHKVSDLKFVFNSKGGWASVGQLHFHGLFDQKKPWPIENASTISIADANGVNVAQVTDYPAGAIVFSGNDAENLAKETVQFVDYLESKGITYNCLITKEQIYVFPRPERSLQPSQVFKKRFSVYDLCGVNSVADEEIYNNITAEQIESEIRQASYSKGELESLIENYLSQSSLLGKQYKQTKSDLYLLSLDDTKASNVQLTGGKGASLYHLSQISRLPVPPGFVVTTKVYERFIGFNNLDSLITQLDELSAQWISLEHERRVEGAKRSAKEQSLELQIQELISGIRKRFERGNMPPDIVEEIKVAYEQLNKHVKKGRFVQRLKKGILVAVRSSATAEDMPEASFAGQQNTYLNIAGTDQVLKSIRKVFGSLFTERAVQYRNELRAGGEDSVSHQKVKIAAVVQAQVPAKAAGVAFNINPATGEQDLYISAVHGFGEKLVGGETSADAWVLDKDTLAIKQRFLRGVEVGLDENISQDSFALSDKEVVKIARRIRQIANYYHVHFGTVYIDVEFVKSKDGTDYYVQARPETIWSKGTPIVGFKIANEALANAEIIYEGGLCAFPGAAYGRIHIIEQESDVHKIEYGEIFVGYKTVPQYAVVLDRPSALVVEKGSITSHAAIVGREKHKPTIVAARNIVQALKPYDGQEVTLDAATGRIYKGKLKLEQTELTEAPNGGLSDNTEEWSVANARADVIKKGREDGRILGLNDGLYLRRPMYELAPLQLDLFAEGGKFVGRQLGIDMRHARQENHLYVNIDDKIAIEAAFRKMNLDQLEGFARRIEEVTKSYDEASSNLTLERLDEFISLYIEMIGWYQWVYALDEALEQQCNERLRELPPSAQRLFKIDSSQYKSELVRLEKDQRNLVEKARIVENLFQGTTEEIKQRLQAQASDLYKQIVTFARTYRFEYPTWKVESPVELVIDILQKNLAMKSSPVPRKQPAQLQTPDLATFNLSTDKRKQIIRTWNLLAQRAVSNDNEPHLFIRGQWRLLDILKQEELKLITANKLQFPGEIFSISLPVAFELIGHDYSRIGNHLKESYTPSEALTYRPSTVVEVDRKNPIPPGAVMVVRDEQAKLRILVDQVQSTRVNVRNAADLEEFLPDFSRATERIPLHGYHSPNNFKYKLYSGWNYLPQEVKAKLLSLFEKQIVPLTYNKGEQLPGFSVLMETTRSHDVAPGRGGLLLADDHALIFADERGEEYVLTVKACGTYDGTFEVRTRKTMKGVLRGKTAYKISETPRGYMWEQSAYDENEHWEALRAEPESEEFSYPLPAFVVSFEIEGRRLALVGRADPGNRRIGQFWWGNKLSKEQRVEMSRTLGRVMGTMLLKRRPAFHTALNLENIADDGRAIPAYTDGNSVKYLDTKRRARAILNVGLEFTLSRALTKFKDLHSAEGPRPYEEYRDPFWEGFVQVIASSPKVSEVAKESLTSIINQGTSINTLAEVEDVLWKHYLPLEIVKARFKANINPLHDFQKPDKEEELYLPSLAHSLDWIPDEIEIYETASILLDQDAGKQAQQDLRRYIIETLTKLRSALNSAGIKEGYVAVSKRDAPRMSASGDKDVKKQKLECNEDYIILDIDGVILDTISINRRNAAVTYCKIFNGILPEEDVAFDGETLRMGEKFYNDRLGRSTEENIKEAVAIAIERGVQVKGDAEDLARRYNDDYKARRDAEVKKIEEENPDELLLPGAREFIIKMHGEGRKLFIASSASSRKNSLNILRRTGITEKYFSKIYIVPSLEDKTDMIIQILKENRIEPEEALFIDDAPNVIAKVRERLGGKLNIIGMPSTPENEAEMKRLGVRACIANLGDLLTEEKAPGAEDASENDTPKRRSLNGASSDKPQAARQIIHREKALPSGAQLRFHAENAEKGWNFPYDMASLDILRQRPITTEYAKSKQSLIVALPDDDAGKRVEQNIELLAARIHETAAYRNGKVILNTDQQGHFRNHITILSAKDMDELGENAISTIKAETMKTGPIDYRLSGLFISPVDGRVSINAYDSTGATFGFRARTTRKAQKVPMIHCAIATVIQPLIPEERIDWLKTIREFEHTDFGAIKVKEFNVVSHTNDLLSNAKPVKIFALKEKYGVSAFGAYGKFLQNNSDLFSALLTDRSNPALLRVPIEAIESVGVANIKDFLEAFQSDHGGYVELYYMSGIGEVSENVYQKYGLQKKALPKEFKRTRENTVTLFPALKGEEINQSTIASRLGNFDLSAKDTILSPIGLQHDPAGLIRATILGLKIMDIARQIKQKGIDGINKDTINLEILHPLRSVCDAEDFSDFNLSPDDIISLAAGDINKILDALKKLIKLLPIMPIDAEELRHIYEHAKAIITAA